MQLVKRQKPLLAIVIALNDLEQFHGGSRNGLKSEIGYFDQFLMLYQSIISNWQRKYFDYNIYLLHSIPFSDQKTKILNTINVKVEQVVYPHHTTKIRPMCYSHPIDCDFRLVLDVDMLALNEPKFNFKLDAQAMYGGNKYNTFQWSQICNFLDCQIPKQKCLKVQPGSYTSWSFKEHYLFQTGAIKRRKFPYFNNGAILIRNSKSNEFVQVWERYRSLYTKYVLEKFNLDIDLEGQDVVGLAIANITKKWSHFPKGFNLIIQEKFNDGKKLIHVFRGKISLLHYIHITKRHKYYNLVRASYNEVLEKYYSQ